MSYSSLLYEVADGIATVRLNEPETLNALTFETEAYRIGLANRVVEHERLMHEAYELATRLKQQPLHALGITKELLEREAIMDLEQALSLEAKARAGCMENADFKEGYRAFVEKRAPVFNRS